MFKNRESTNAVRPAVRVKIEGGWRISWARNQDNNNRRIIDDVLGFCYRAPTADLGAGEEDYNEKGC